VCGPIIAVRSSNDVPWRPPTPECQKRVNGGVARVTFIESIDDDDDDDDKMGDRSCVCHPGI